MPRPRQSRPEDSDPNRHVHFGYVSTDNDAKWHAYVAGPAQWFQCHSKGKTKACQAHLTNDALTCPLCEGGVPREEAGYLPLWREIDGKPCCVIVHPTVREAVDSLPVHRRVIVGRGADDHDGVYVLPALDPRPLFTSSAPWKLRHADILPTLLKLWKLPALTAWVNDEKPVSDPACITRPAQKPDPARQGRSPAPVPIPEDDMAASVVLPDLLERFRKRSGNGQHAPAPLPGE